MSEITLAQTLWTSTLVILRDQISDSVWLAIFAGTTGLYLDENCLTISVPNQFVRDRIEQRYRELVIAAIADAGQPSLGLEIRVDEPAASYEELDESLQALTSDAVGVSAPAVHVVPTPTEMNGNGAGSLASNGHAPTLPGLGDPPATEAPALSSPVGGNLNAKYTFESFVIGSSNRFAHAAALAVAEAPAQAYNPLFVYGSTGLGKTHLLQAIARYVRSDRLGLTARYVTGEAFMNEFIDCLQGKRLEQFKARYRRTDVLLVDDIQFLAGKERIQEEFFHTFNTLHEAGAQVVLSSDRPPRDMATLEERLRSRFEYGLITDIQPPDLETRIAILLKRAHRDDVTVGRDVLEQIAQRVRTNIRELEGALTRVVAFSSLTGRPLTVDLARDVLKDVFPQGDGPLVTIKSIQETVSERFGLSLPELCGPNRSQSIVYPRQVAMYLSRELTDSSLPRIGKEFGGRDHTTVIHAVRQIEKLRATDAELDADVRLLMRQLEG
mgnify:CR=1 FL=1